ncbi:septal ring lytic transglycosylase RlpA family protein [Rubrivirga sp.]|uniref:septal ring lytic transglycosylase RlpA family protein n=1 Tax=Rubrivirga sp. TaxID=1885344 RepID=UPI003B52DB23
MTTPTDPALSSRRSRVAGRIRRLGSRIAGARRRAAVVTSVALLAAGSTACTDAPTVSPTVSEAPAVVAAPAEPSTPPPATMLPPAVPIHLVSDAEPSRTASAIEGGRASYYGAELAGNPTASGEPFDPADLTAAHRTLPLGTRVRVTHARTGRSVVVRVNDRGPFHGERVIDVSRAAADEIGLTRSGTAEVELERLPKATGARG